MSIIQTIRDKGAKVSVVLIALALIGFILTDYFSGRGRNLFSGGSTTVGTVNGKTISYDDFKTRVDQNISRTEAMYQQNGMTPPPVTSLTKDAVDQTWNQEITRLLYREELNRLGMQIGKKERGDILYGPNAPDDIKQAGTDPNTGIYDPLRAKQAVDQKLKGREWTQEQKDGFNRYIAELDEFRMQEKYNSLFSNSVNFPRWLVEKQTNDNAQVANISMVKMLFTDSSFVDSTIKISDKEIEDHISKNKTKFKQEKSRGISYVTFSAAPTQADSAATKKLLTDLKTEFDTTQDINSFIGRDVSLQSPNIYFPASQLPPVGKDSITRLGKNAVYGPYLEGGAYVMIKMLETKILPDSVKCRHVLISTNIQEGGVDDSTASKRIDSIKNAINGGASWAAMVEKYNPASDGSRQTSGEMTFPSSQIQSGMESGNFAKEFGQFVLFDGKPGDRKVVKTSFGYHYIEIMSFIKPQTHYKLAFLGQEIVPSEQTDSDAQQRANEFFSEKIKDQATFDAAYEKSGKAKGGIKGSAANIGPLDVQVGTMGTTPLVSRGFVMNIYKAKRNEVLQPEKVGSDYVVAIVTDINEEGTMSVAKARPMVEFELRKKKKAEMIKQKIGTITSLEDAAAKLGKPIETVDSLRMDGRTISPKIGNEPRVVGAIFNPANKGKVVTEPIVGLNGVYVIRVESVSATASTEGSVEDQRKLRYQAGKSSQSAPIEGLKKKATIKDKRAERY